jgi:aerobic carbon-monoxide dehydrogenase medium subunit
VIPAPFEYLRATSTEEVSSQLAEHGDDAKLLAGGQSLLPLMKLRLATPAVLIDVARVDGLRYVREDGDVIAIGALTTHRDLERNELLARHAPLVHASAAQIGDPQVRSRGTIGGSIAHADPAGDLPAVVLALDATLVALGPGGQRQIPASEFFTGFFESALQPDELLTEVRVPRHQAFGFVKFSRRAQDWATVGVAAARTDGSASVALVQMGSTPLRAAAVEQALAQGATAQEAASHAADGTTPPSDAHASANYRRHLATVLVRRALEQLGS